MLDLISELGFGPTFLAVVVALGILFSMVDLISWLLHKQSLKPLQKRNRQMKNFVLALVVTLLILSGSVVAQTTQTQCLVRGAQVVAESYDPATRTGTVLISHPQAGEVTGEALAPADRFPNAAQARLMALEGARTVAYGKLAERLCGVSVQQK